MKSDERHFRIVIRGILQEADRQTTPAVNVQQVRKTYQPIGLPTPTTFVALGAISALSKVYSFITCQDPKFPGENTRKLYTKSEAGERLNEAELTDAFTNDLDQLTIFYNQAVLCAKNWGKVVDNANFFISGRNLHSIVKPTNDLVKIRCEATTVSNDQFEDGGSLFLRDDYIKFIKSFIDAAHNDFATEISNQQRSFVSEPGIYNLYRKLIVEEKQQYDNRVSQIN